MKLSNLASNFDKAPFLAVSLMIAAGVGFSAGNLGSSGNGMDSGLEWKNQITVEKNGEQIDQFHNMLTDQGKQYIAGKLFNTSASDALYTSNNFTYISLGNGKDVGADNVTLDSEISDYGLSRAKASSVSSTAVDTYKIEKKFTADLGQSGDPSSVKVNTTGLNFGASGDKLVSGDAFKSANLKDGDQITVTHEITISGSN